MLSTKVLLQESQLCEFQVTHFSPEGSRLRSASRTSWAAIEPAAKIGRVPQKPHERVKCAEVDHRMPCITQRALERVEAQAPLHLHVPHRRLRWRWADDHRLQGPRDASLQPERRMRTPSQRLHTFLADALSPAPEAARADGCFGLQVHPTADRPPARIPKVHPLFTDKSQMQIQKTFHKLLFFHQLLPARILSDNIQKVMPRIKLN